MSSPDGTRGFCGILGCDGQFIAGPPGEGHAGCRVLVSGYLADRSELRRRLGLDSATNPGDGVLLAAAFRCWGRDLSAHVLGEYAAVIYDSKARTALLTHDSLGLAALFYSVRRDALFFATNLSDLVDEAACQEFDNEYFADYLALGFVVTDRTPYSSIHRLLPGRSLCWCEGKLTELKTWDLADVPAIRCRSNEEYEERFRVLLEAGVRSAVDTSASVWVSLSGGLDSSTVACVAARLGRVLPAFSVVSPAWPDTDEVKWMRAVVEAYDLPWHPVDVETVLPFSKLPRHFLAEPTEMVVDEGLLSSQNELLGCGTVLLNGNGGDMVFAGFPGAIPVHLADPLFELRPLDALRGAREWMRGAREKRSHGFWLLRGLVEPAVCHLAGRHLQGADRLPLPPWLRRSYADSMRLQERSRRRRAPRCQQPGRQALWDAIWACSVSEAPYPEQSYTGRRPLMYRPLVEFMCGIPWEQKLRPRCDRYLQRRALKAILPEIVRRRAWKPTGTCALVEGLNRSPEWQEFLNDRPAMADRGLADAEAWRQAVRQAAAGQTHGDKFFLAGVAIEAWLKLLHHRPVRNRLESLPLASGVAIG